MPSLKQSIQMSHMLNVAFLNNDWFNSNKLNQKPSKTTHHISQNPIPTKIKGERSPPKPEILKSHS